jgi:hypothetical protein
MQQFKIIFIVCVSFLVVTCFVACTKNKYLNNVKGYQPIYEANNSAFQIVSLAPTNYLGAPGKIYQNNFLSYQIETGKGIHIIDCSDIKNPTKVAFIKIAGVTEMAITGNILYADNNRDLVAIDITDFKNVKEVDRINNAYDLSALEVPPHSSSFFECVDAEKGIVVDWRLTDLENPKCKTN